MTRPEPVRVFAEFHTAAPVVRCWPYADEQHADAWIATLERHFHPTRVARVRPGEPVPAWAGGRA